MYIYNLDVSFSFPFAGGGSRGVLQQAATPKSVGKCHILCIFQVYFQVKIVGVLDPPPSCPINEGRGDFFFKDVFLSEFFKNVNFLKIGPQLFDL